MKTRLRLRVRCQRCGSLKTSIHQAETTETLMAIFVGIPDLVEACSACEAPLSPKNYFVVQIPYPVGANSSVA